MNSEMVFIGPFFAPLVYVLGFISLILAILLIFLPRYRDNLLERIGASMVAFAVVAIWYHMIDGFFIPRAYWMYGWGWALVIVGMLYKLPRKKE